MPTASRRWICSSSRQSRFVCSTACLSWGTAGDRFFGLASHRIRPQNGWQNSNRVHLTWAMPRIRNGVCRHALREEPGIKRERLNSFRGVPCPTQPGQSLPPASPDRAHSGGFAPLPGLVAQAVMREPLAFIAPRDDTLAAGRTTMNLGDALVLPLILPGRPHGLRAEVELAASKLRLPPNVTVEIDALDQIKSLVAKRAGYSILSSRFAHQGPIAAELAILPIANPAIERTISLAHAQDRPMSIAALAIHSAILELFSAMSNIAPSAAATPASAQIRSHVSSLA